MLECGNDLVLDYIAKDVIAADRIVHSYPIDWRTKQPVLIRASDQWFINTDKIKTDAIEAVSKKNSFEKQFIICVYSDCPS